VGLKSRSFSRGFSHPFSRRNQTKVGLKYRHDHREGDVPAKKSDQGGIEIGTRTKLPSGHPRRNQTKVGLKWLDLSLKRAASARRNQTKVGLK